MMDREEAINEAVELIKSDNKGEMKTYNGNELVIVDDDVSLHGIAWLIPYNTREYLEHGDVAKCIVPGVVVVPSVGGKAHYAPGVPSADEYVDAMERRGAWADRSPRDD